MVERVGVRISNSKPSLDVFFFCLLYFNFFTIFCLKCNKYCVRKSKIAMLILLPRFENSYALLITACGRLKSNKTVGSKVKAQKARVARYQTAAGRAFLRAWLNNKSEKFLHVDCALHKFFPKSKLPKVTHRKEEVLRIINSALGIGIDVNIRACFIVPMSQLPESGVIRSMSVEQKTVDVSITLAGASLSLTGTPVRRIDWHQLEDKKGHVYVRLEGEITTTVSEEYLCEIWSWINSQFCLFVLGKRANA